MATEIINIEVSSNIKSVIRDTDKLAKSMRNVKKETEDLGKGTKAGAQGFGGVSSAVRKLGVAIKAIGIGMLIAAFVELKNIFGKNQEVADATSEAYETFKIVLGEIVTAIGNLIEYISSSSNNFGKLTSVVMSFLQLGLLPLKQAYASTELVIRSIGNVTMQFLSLFTGKFDKRMRKNVKEMENLLDTMKKNGREAKDALNNIGKNFKGAVGEIQEFMKVIDKEFETVDMKRARAAARAIVRAEKAARLAKAESEIVIAGIEQKMAAQQKLADNEQLSFDKRRDALFKIEALQLQMDKEEKKAAKEKVAAAQKLLNKYKNNVDMQIALKKAESERDILAAKHTQNAIDRTEKRKQLELELAEIKFQLSLEGQSALDKELAELERAYEKKKEMAELANEDKKMIEEQYLTDIAEIRAKFADEKEEVDEENSGREVTLYEVSAAAIADIFSALNSMMEARSATIEKNYKDEVKLAKGNEKTIAAIDEKYDAKRKELAEKQKKLQIAMATVTMFQSVIAAYNSGSQLPGPAGIIGGPVAASIALAAGLANINAIAKQDVGSGGGGGGVSAAASPEPPAPEMMSGSFSLEGGKPVEPLQAYVVSDDITDSQDKLAIIRRRATI